VEALAARSLRRRYAAGEVIYLAGDRPAGLLVVLEGRVRVVRGRGDRQHLVHEEGPGGALGEVPLFAGGAYPATAIAAAPTVCLLVSADALRAAVRSDPEIAFRFLARLADRVRHLVDRLDRLAAQDVRGRLAALLLARERATGAGAPFTLGGTQAQVAEDLGTVREVVVRALRGLCAAGVIGRAGGGRYRVLDAPALERLAAG